MLEPFREDAFPLTCSLVSATRSFGGQSDPAYSDGYTMICKVGAGETECSVQAFPSENTRIEDLRPGDEFELSREHVVTVFKTTHTVPSVGYVVWDRRRKLKPELQDLAQDEIRDRKLAGEEVTAEVRFPLVCYTGDTSPKGLDNCEAAFQARILITELTFYRPEHRREKIHKFGHMHLDDFVEQADRFENELIIAGHFSTRYNESQLARAVQKRVPEQLRDRLDIWV